MIVDPDTKRGLYGKYRVEKVNGKPVGRCFVLDYDSDPHARVALEAYADSCAEEYPELAADLYRGLGIDIDIAQIDMTSSLSVYLSKWYRGRWVAIQHGRVAAAGDSLKEARAAAHPGGTLLYVPREGESDHR